jgi:membrane protein YdbS with pleckstrin-like domain
MDPTRRLLFWLRIPYVADVALVLIGVGLLASGRGVGTWVLVFAGVRAVVGTIALVIVAPRVIRRRSEGKDAAPRE